MLTVILPPAAALEAAAIELNASAPDVKRRISVSKALYDLLIGQPAIVRVAGGLVAVVEVPMVPDVARAKVAHTGGSLAAARVRAATKLANYNDAVFRERQNPVG